MDLYKYTYRQYIYIINQFIRLKYEVIHRKIPSKTYRIKPNSDCIHHTPTNLEPNRHPLGSKTIGKGVNKIRSLADLTRSRKDSSMRQQTV